MIPDDDWVKNGNSRENTGGRNCCPVCFTEVDPYEDEGENHRAYHRDWHKNLMAAINKASFVDPRNWGG